MVPSPEPAQASDTTRWLRVAARLGRVAAAAEADTMDAAMEVLVEDLASFCGADTAFVTLIDDQERVADEWNWCRPGRLLATPQMGTPIRDVFGSAWEWLALGHLVAIDDLDQLDLSPPERALADRNGVRSMVFAPIRVGSTLLGLVGLHAFDEPRPWPSSLQRQLEVVAQLLGQTLQRTRQRGELAMAQARARRIAEYLPDGLVMLDTDGLVAWASPSWSRLTGLATPAVLGRPFPELCSPEERPALAAELAAPTGGPLEVRLGSESGGWRWFELTWTVAEADGALPPETVIVARDAEDRRREADRLRLATRTDSLTGLLNRYGVEHEVRTISGPIVVAFCDVDGFKGLNDRWGHAAGDAALEAVAATLAGGTRAGDLVARVGGDEFVVILCGDDLAEAESVTRRLARAVGQTRVDGRPGGLGLSVGLSPVGRPDDFMDLESQADQAMYRVKRARRGQAPALEDPRDA